MSWAEICISAYLIVGAMATALILTVLKASKRRYNETKKLNHDQPERSAFPEPNKKPSRSHS